MGKKKKKAKRHSRLSTSNAPYECARIHAYSRAGSDDGVGGGVESDQSAFGLRSCVVFFVAAVHRDSASIPSSTTCARYVHGSCHGKKNKINHNRVSSPFFFRPPTGVNFYKILLSSLTPSYWFPKR